MPEVEKIKSGSEQMVPIDTSGDPVDVELKDEKDKEDEVVAEEVTQETPVEDKKKTPNLRNTKKKRNILKLLKSALIK